MRLRTILSTQNVQKDGLEEGAAGACFLIEYDILIKNKDLGFPQRVPHNFIHRKCAQPYADKRWRKAPSEAQGATVRFVARIEKSPGIKRLPRPDVLAHMVIPRTQFEYSKPRPTPLT